MKELKRYFAYIGKYKVKYWSILGMTLVTSALFQLIHPYMNKLLFNGVEYGDAALFGRAAILCGVLVLYNCLAPYRRYFQMRVVRNLVFDIKISLFEKLTRMNMNYFEGHHSGEALKILNWDANSLKDSYFSHVFWVSVRLVNGVTAVAAMLVYSPILTLVSVSFSLVTMWISVQVTGQIKKMDKTIQDKVSRLTARLSDILSGFPLLKMYEGASIVYDNFYGENERILKEEGERVQRRAMLEMVAFLLGILGSFGTIGAGVYLVSEGRLDYGSVMAIVSLQMSVSFMVQSFGSSLAAFSSSLVKAGRVFDFLEMEGEESESILYHSNELEKEEKTIQEVIGRGTESMAVEIEKLTFSYDGERKVLENYSLVLTDGEKRMLKGESGCGKSTLLKLIMGFRKGYEGSIKLYGKELQEYSLQELRELITYVPQRSYLFEGTIGENIAMAAGGRQVSCEKIKKAAKMAYAEEFISTLPKGYDTPVEAGGSNLSLGQRQRIALAAAFLKDSPLLLMDEPTSALDAHSEQEIYKAVGEHMQDRTVIWVSHRGNLQEEA